jgi:DNA invertase Pin-like site-specific DNA recombinase
MAKNDSDLFDRLRDAGIRKRVAEMLSEIGEGAGKKAREAARNAVDDLRALADEIERRLPGATPGAKSTQKPAGRTTRRSPAATARASRSRAADAAAGRGTSRSAQRKRAAAASSRPAPAPSRTRAPRGENKAKILGALVAGPKTASEIARETGIGTGTVGSTLSKMLTAGEVAKADRGYRLPT